MILVLVEGTYALRVHDEHFVRLFTVGTLLDFKRLIPDPEALCARIDCWTHIEPRLVSRLIQ